MVACITASIELAANARSDLTYIPGWRILDRAQAQLRYPVSVHDRNAKRRTTAELIPDSLFGLEYHAPEANRYRFFVVEADRATEPLTSKNAWRKSAARSLTQYEVYAGGGAYRDHLKLTAPMLVLNVTTTARRAEQLSDLLAKSDSKSAPLQLMQTWEAFGEVWRPQKPRFDLLEDKWDRAVGDGFRIDRV